MNHETYRRICEAMNEAKKSPNAVLHALYLGKTEFVALEALCIAWGHGWPPGAPHYNPEMQRAKFNGVPIFVVDAESHLSAR